MEGSATPSDAAAYAVLADLREEVAQSRADIRESIQNHSLSNVQQFTHVTEKACDAEKEAIRSQYEGKLQTLTSSRDIENRITGAERSVLDRLAGFERNVDDRFASAALNNATGFAAVALGAAKDAAAVAAQIAECCCETKLALSELACKVDTNTDRLSREHVKQVLAETKDELFEARLDLILAKTTK